MGSLGTQNGEGFGVWSQKTSVLCKFTSSSPDILRVPAHPVGAAVTPPHPIQEPLSSTSWDQIPCSSSRRNPLHKHPGTDQNLKSSSSAPQQPGCSWLPSPDGRAARGKQQEPSGQALWQAGAEPMCWGSWHLRYTPSSRPGTACPLRSARQRR